MKHLITPTLLVVISLSGFAFSLQKQSASIRTEGNAMWLKFQAAVAKGDADLAGSMTKFPLDMPYGVKSIQTVAAFKKQYTKMFDSETKKCFAKAHPSWDETGKNRFYIPCGEAMMYWFERSGGTFRFSAVDNVNE
jgi:hypothetical protein